MKRVTILAGIAILVLAACGGAASSAGAGGRVATTLTDNSIAFDTATVTNGPVTFSAKNTGSVLHSLVLLKTNLTHDKIPADPADPAKADERGSVGGSGQIGPGQTKEFTLSLAPGKYVLICNEPAHYIVGMHVALTVN